jgi:hypothetical protein
MSKHNGNVGRVSDSVTRQVQATDAPANEDVGLRFANPTAAESNLPIIVQLVDWARIPNDFHAEIAQNYVVVQQAKSEVGRLGV